jgi:hypothetical protein
MTRHATSPIIGETLTMMKVVCGGWLMVRGSWFVRFQVPASRVVVKVNTQKKDALQCTVRFSSDAAAALPLHIIIDVLLLVVRPILQHRSDTIAIRV